MIRISMKNRDKAPSSTVRRVVYIELIINVVRVLLNREIHYIVSLLFLVQWERRENTILAYWLKLPLRRRLVARRDWGQSPTCTRPWFQSWCLDSRFQIFFFKFRFFHLFYMLVLSGQFVWHVIRPLVFFVSLL